MTYKGKPVPDALVAFHPAGAAPAASKPGDGPPAGPPRPTGKTDAEGKFKLHTYVGDDGAPAGDYQVTVSFAGSAETRNFMAKDASKALNITLPPVCRPREIGPGRDRQGRRQRARPFRLEVTGAAFRRRALRFFD